MKILEKRVSALETKSGINTGGVLKAIIIPFIRPGIDGGPPICTGTRTVSVWGGL